MQNPRKTADFATRKEERKNEKEVVEVFVYMIPGKCEEKKWTNFKIV